MSSRASAAGGNGLARANSTAASTASVASLSIAAARKGKGPMLLECLTHRLRGHYEGDPGQYREAMADEEWKQKDPILRLQRTAAEAGWFDQAAAAEVEAEAREAVEAAIEFGRASASPSPEVAAGLVYADSEAGR